jgi:hypothetical protein
MISIDDLTAAGYVFEQARGISLETFQVELITACGYENCLPEEMKTKVVKHLLSAKDATEANRATAYWALGKSVDEKLVGFFRKQLVAEIERSAADAVYQILIALNDLGEPVFGSDRGGTYDLFDRTLNFRDAHSYIRPFQQSAD